MQKENLLKRCESFEKIAEHNNLMGYPRKNQNEIARIATAIVQVICREESITPSTAKYALKMAEEIIEQNARFEPIS